MGKVPDHKAYNWGLIVTAVLVVAVFGGVGYLAGRVDQYRSDHREYTVGEYHGEKNGPEI